MECIEYLEKLVHKLEEQMTEARQFYRDSVNEPDWDFWRGKWAGYIEAYIIAVEILAEIKKEVKE